MSDRLNDESPFHKGEVAAQTRVGMHEKMVGVGIKFIRPFLLQQHRDFYSQLPFIIVAACDENGLPWVTMLTGNALTEKASIGEVNFITSNDETHLRFNTQLTTGDALDKSLVKGACVGLIGIELASKRRNRANGTLSEVNSDSMLFRVTQSFGNCPQYILPRNWHIRPQQQPLKVEHHHQLTNDMQQWIANADTLFIGSGYSQSSIDEGFSAMDASHRGGKAGFVKIVNDKELVLPDYRGNNFFNTIGNIMLNPKIGLLFVDFTTGSLLQITAQAQVDWNSPSPEPKAKPAQAVMRLIHIKIDKIILLKNAKPLSWTLS
ncbi:MAG: putative pyridoxine 5'-phosphate oxidase superfamily flavin-nucleotide-binding protein [Oceanospirillaceae bacterium]|jgi:predicted pyridoxine 5'-phosphate oxidase superfamily flavin-nucleotide-binding protein